MMTASCTIGISSFQCQALTKCQCNKNSAKGVAVMRRGGSSWLASVKSAFRSPSKHCEKTQELDEDNSKVPSRPHSRESLSVMLPPLPFLSHIFCSQKRKVKRRCFFRKPSRHKQQLPLKQSPPPPSPLPEQRHAIAAAVISPSLNREYYAAIVIQTAFRAYLARRALRALKGLVKLQALVRGHNVRKQANMTLQCMQSLVRVQNRVLDQRIRLSLSHYAAPQQILERRSLSREGLVTEEIQAIQKSRREAAIKREKLNSYAFSHQNWRSDCNLCLMNGELGGDPESRIWLDRWLASRKSFDNRSRSRGAEALEIDTAQPCSYATPRRQPHYNRHHLSSPRHSSPATPPPSPPLPEWRRSMAAHSSAKARAMPNYMSATESAKTRLRLQSSPRRRPGTPARERVGSAKKQLTFPAPEEYGARSPSIKSAMGRLVSEQRSNVSSSCAESFDGESLSSSTTDLRRWLR